MTARWLTPNAPEPHKFFTRRLLIPAASDFLGLVNGALFELCQQHNWEQDGDMTPEETASFFMDLWRQYLENENEPPEWDTPENVDGEPAQPWYEQLEDWIIQGFLAVTFTPLAALVYSTTVPKIRVAIRTGNIGALFRVLINGVEVWTGDSYSPITDILEQVFDNPNPGSAATVRVIHNGNGGHGADEVKLEYIRGEAVSDMIQTILRGDPGGCGIQWSLDNGGSWNTVDLSYCISTLARDQILQAIQDGIIATPQQQGPTNSPGPGSCETFNVSLSANSAWVCPTPVNEGDTIDITDMVGSWNDGSGLGALGPWFCPDGGSYGLGVCGGGGDTSETDPLPTANHMSLVGHVGEEWFSAASQYAVPTGVENGQVILQANDATIADNLGAITCKVEICRAGTLEWYHEFDLAVTGAGWELLRGIYTAGVGYEEQYVTSSHMLEIRKPVLRAGTITYCRLKGLWSMGSSNPYNALDIGIDSYSTELGSKLPSEMTSPYDFVFLGNMAITNQILIQSLSCYMCSGGSGSINFIAIGGTGVDPF